VVARESTKPRFAEGMSREKSSKHSICFSRRRESSVLRFGLSLSFWLLVSGLQGLISMGWDGMGWVIATSF